MCRWLQAIGAPAFQLLSSRSGQLLLARVALDAPDRRAGLAAAAGRPRAGLAAGGSRWRWAAGVVLTFSLNSHGAAEAQGAALAVALDWLHLAAMVAWLGGLLPLAARDRRGAARVRAGAAAGDR